MAKKDKRHAKSQGFKEQVVGLRQNWDPQYKAEVKLRQRDDVSLIKSIDKSRETKDLDKEPRSNKKQQDKNERLSTGGPEFRINKNKGSILSIKEVDPGLKSQ